MQIPQKSFDPETVALMGRVCDDAWHEIQIENFLPSQADASEIRSLIAVRIIAAVANGESDPERLKLVALDAVDCRIDGRPRWRRLMRSIIGR